MASSRPTMYYVMMFTLMIAVVFGAAPACEEDNPSPLANDINAIMKSTLASRQDAINNDVQSRLAQKPNLLPAPFAVSKENTFRFGASCTKYRIPSCLFPGHDAKYGYKGNVNSIVIKDNSVKVVVQDAKVCAIEITSIGFESVVTGEMQITLGQLRVDGEVNIYVERANIDIDIWATVDVAPMTVKFQAKTSMNYADLSDKHCTLSDIKELNLSIPVPQIVEVDHDAGSGINSILDVGNMDDLINDYLKTQMQAGVNSAWSTGGIEDYLETLLETQIAKEEDGISTTCPACAPGQSGDPITGCFEINACVAHGCSSKNELCRDKPAPAPDSDTGRTCDPCGDGTRPSASMCIDCNVGFAGRNGYCAQCTPTKDEYADAPGLSECKVATTCRAGESVTFPGNPARSRTCETIGIIEGKFTDGPNQVKRAWSTCNAGEYEAAPGTTSSDRDCESCPDDKYQPEAEQSSCLPLKVCQPGSKVVRARSAINNRECAECDDGFFSNTTNAPTCTKHQICANNQYRKNNGSKTTDHICGDHSDCVGGEYVKEEPTATSPRVCDSCGTGTVTDTINAPQCRPWKNCSAGYSVDEEPTTSVDRKCSKCFVGEFSTTQNAAECQPWTVCLPGEFDKSTGASSTVDRDCEGCGVGEYSGGSIGPRRRRSEDDNVSRQQRSTKNGDVVWLCADVCAQKPALSEVAADITCAPLVIGECAEMKFGAITFGDYLETKDGSGVFYWKPIVGVDGDISVDMYSDEQCTSTPGEATTKVYPTEAAAASGPLAASFLQTGKYCTTTYTASDCVEIKMGFTIKTGLNKCVLMEYHITPPVLDNVLVAVLPIVFNVEFLEECRAVEGKPETCPATTIAATQPTTPRPADACKNTQFTCASGACIDASRRCDGFDDCADGSDESGCTTSSTTRTTNTETSVTVTTSTMTSTTFIPLDGEQCRRWRTCTPGSYVAVAGTSSNNRECGRCVLGSNYTDLADMDTCVDLTDCFLGELVDVKPTVKSDRKCVPVTVEAFTDKLNSISETLWDTCVAGSHVVTKGTTTSNRECAPCPAGHFQSLQNQDDCIPFAKCVGGTIKEEGTIITDRKCEPCAVGEFKNIDAASSDACSPWVTDCDVGFYVKTKGTTTSDRTCDACSFGEFSPDVNSEQCTVGKPCLPGTEVDEIAAFGADTTCQACLEDSFSNTTMLQCQPHTTCHAGQYILLSSSSTTDRSCSPCVSGSFSNANNTASCTTYTDCKDFTVLFAGNTTNDHTCNNASIISDESKAAGSSGMIAGFAVGGIVVVVLVALVLFFLLKRGKTDKAITDAWNREEAFENPLYDATTGQNKSPPPEFALYGVPQQQQQHQHQHQQQQQQQGNYEDGSFGYADVPGFSTYVDVNLSDGNDAAHHDLNPGVRAYMDVNPPASGVGGGYMDVNPPASGVGGGYMDVSPEVDIADGVDV